MRLNDLIHSQASTVFLNTEHFAETVTHRPLGDDAFDAAVVANVVWEEPAENADGGQGQKLRGRLDVPSCLALDVRDQWLIEGRLYQTRLVGEAQGGLQAVLVQRTTIQRRGSARGTQ